VRLLAQRDYIFWPRSIGTTIWYARQCYASAGLPWASGEETGAGRVRAQRALEELVADGNVIAIKNGKSGRTEHVRLTDRGEVMASAIACTPSLLGPLTWAVFEALERRNEKVGHVCYTPEDDLIPAYRAALAARGSAAEEDRVGCLLEIALCLVPFAVRGWIAGGMTVQKNARYWLTETASEAAPPEIPFPKIDDATADAGVTHYIKHRDNPAPLPSSPPNEIGPIPLPVAAIGEAEIRAWTISAEMAREGR